MIRNDYIMRLIEQFAQALAKILFKKENNEQVIIKLDDLSKQYLGIDIQMLNSMTSDEILSLFTINGDLYFVKCFMAAELFRKECEANELIGASYDSNFGNYLKSFLLYFESIFNIYELQNSDVFIIIQKIINIISNYNLPSSVKFKIFQFYELSNNFAAAENIIFELVDDKYDKFCEEGINFYQRLLTRNDEELEKGNLPRIEILEGLNTIRNRRGG
jgi:hypothetical protein